MGRNAELPRDGKDEFQILGVEASPGVQAVEMDQAVDPIVKHDRRANQAADADAVNAVAATQRGMLRHVFGENGFSRSGNLVGEKLGELDVAASAAVATAVFGNTEPVRLG